ncbi:MAG: carboxypeptidase-like regulatory domain-containing protein [bacterium]
MKRWIWVFLGLGVLSAALAWLNADRDVTPPANAPSPADTVVAPMGDAALRVEDAGSDANARATKFHVALAPEDGPATVEIGAAAIYPPFEGKTASGDVVVAATVDDEPLDDAEVRIMTRVRGFWGPVDLADPRVDLVAAKAYTVCVSDGKTAITRGQVRASLAVIGFLHDTQELNSAGCARFWLPEQPYTFTAKAPGFLPQSTTSDGDVTMTLLPSAYIRGTVVDGQDTPIAATVSAIQGDRVVALTSTDATGSFAFSELPMQSTRLLAVAAGFSATQTYQFEPSRVEPAKIVMQPAVPVRVSVVSKSKSPVAGATVAWSTALEHASKPTDGRGEVTFEAVPSDAVITATLGRFRSPKKVAAASMTLVLGGDPPPEKRVRVRGAEVVTFDVTSDISGACETQGQGRDWVVRGCERGPATIRIQTTEGPFTWKGELKQAVEVNIPPMTFRKIFVVGDWPLKLTKAFVVLDDTRIAVPVFDDHIRVATRHERFRLVLIAGTETVERDVEATSSEVTIEVNVTPTKSFHVVDDRNAAVTGAWIGVIKGDALLAQTQSAGNLPSQVRIPAGAEVLAVSPRMGQGRLVEGKVVLDQAVGAWTPVGLAQVEAALGAKLVPSGNGLIIDAIPGTAAAQRGIQRGAWYVISTRNRGRINVVVWQNNAYKTFEFGE